jgi:hypothetical protein
MKRRKIMKQSKKVKQTRVRREIVEPFKIHWWQEIEPRGAALLGQALRPCLFVLKNRGSHEVRLRTSRGDDVDISPGVVRVIYIEDDVRVENNGETRVLIEFDILACHDAALELAIRYLITGGGPIRRPRRI